MRVARGSEKRSFRRGRVSCVIGTAFLAAMLAFPTGTGWGQDAARKPAARSKAKASSNRLSASDSDGPVRIRVSRKVTVYDRASREHPAEYAVRGPATIRVVSRLLLAPPVVTGSNHEYEIEIDGLVLQTVKVQALAHKTAKVVGGGAVTALNSNLVRVPGGAHKIRVHPVEEGVLVAVKALRPAKKLPRLAAFAPETFERALRVQVKDVESTAYRMTTVKPVGVTLLGPVKLRILSRLDFGPATGATQAYVLKVSLNGKPWRSFSLKTRASHTTTYPDMVEITPGMVRTVTVPVPSGSNDILVFLDGTTAGGATVQLQVPRKAVHGTAGNGHPGGNGRI